MARTTPVFGYTSGECGSASGLVSCADFKSVGSRGNPALVGSIPTRFRQFPSPASLEEALMKKLVLLIVVVVGVWLGVNYMKTGDLSFFPKAISAEEEQLR